MPMVPTSREPEKRIPPSPPITPTLEPDPYQTILESSKCHQKILEFHIHKVVSQGSEEPFQLQTLLQVSDQYTVEKSFMGFQSLYLLHKPNNSLWQIIQKGILDKVLSGAFIFVICCVLKILTIPYMTKLIEWYDKSETTTEEDFYNLTSIGIIIALLWLRASLLKMATIRVGKASIIAEMNLLCLVQNKILNLKYATRQNIQLPKISDVFSKDLARLKFCIENFHQLVDFVVILGFSTFVLYMDLDKLSLLIPGLFLAFLVIQVQLNRKWIKNYRQHLEFFDMRISTLRDMLNTIKLIKINSWELVMEYFINKKRVDEKSVIKKMHGLKELQECLILIFPYQVMFLIVYLYIKFYNEPLKIHQVYSITLYTILLAFSLRNVCHWMLNYKLSKELFRRLGSLTQMGDYVKPEDNEGLETGDVQFKNASFAWTSPENTKATVMMNNDSKNPVFFQPTGFINPKIPTVLSNLDYQFKARSLSVVIGCRESGKSSLLYSIMSEMIQTDGSVNTNGRMAYVPEEPVLLSGTSIRANIVFGSPYDPHKYDKVIFICQLRGLFTKYILGDYSKIGDRNISLSKSIRARISLARAVYSDADIYLIDNIWKHQESNLYEKIFRKVVQEQLKHKTRIIVTNDINALKDYENIVLLKEGRIKVSGDMRDLVSSEDYLEFISNANNIKIVDQKKVRDVLDLYVNIEDADCQANPLGTAKDEVDIEKVLTEKRQQISMVKQKVDGLASPNPFGLKISALNSPTPSRKVISRLDSPIPWSSDGDQGQSSKQKVPQQCGQPPRRRSRLFRVDSSGENVSISEFDLESRRNDSFYKVQKPGKQPQKLPAHIQLPKKMNMPSLHHWIDQDLEVRGEEEVTRKKAKKPEWHKTPECVVYWEFMREGNRWHWILLCSVMIVVCLMICTFYQGKWSRAWYHDDKDIYLMVYLLSLLIIFALCILKSHLHGAHYARTSYQIHVKMLYNVLRRSMTWFKFNAYEKIIDDFRSYLEIVDTDLPNTIGTNCQLFSIVLFGILSGMSIMPLLINIMAGILVFWGVSNGRFYRTANEFFFLKSKIIHELKKNVTQTQKCTSQIRLYNHENYVTQVFNRNMNQQIKVNMNRLFAEAGSLTITEGWVTFAFMFYILLYWCSKFVEINLVKDSSGSTFVLVWFWVMMQVFPGLIFGYNEMCEKMHSIDCIKNFILDENLEGEFAFGKHLSEQENHGEIIYNAVNVRYEKIDDRALSNVSFKVKGGEKVAIIGRSGSGKSTLQNLLIKLVDLEMDETEKKLGSILVDRKNIEEVPLSNLRKKIFLIPQKPILLNGNLIFNMDPLMQYKDIEILGALKKSKLWDLFFASLKETQAMQTLGGETAQGGPIGSLNAHKTVFSTTSKRLEYLARMNQKISPNLSDQMKEFFKPHKSPNSKNLWPGIPSPPINPNQPTEPRGLGQTSSNTQNKFVNDGTMNHFESTHQMNFEDRQFDKKILEIKIENYGENLSTRARQLIYLARAILAKPKILLIDELSFDLDADNWGLIQEILRTQFKETTIMQVLMMDNGEIVEDGSPGELMGDEESLLSKLVEEFGSEFESMGVYAPGRVGGPLDNQRRGGRCPVETPIMENKREFKDERLAEDSDSF